MMIVRIPLAEELPQLHLCRLKPSAYSDFVEPIRYAFAQEHEVLPWGGPAPAFLVRCGGVDALVDYADTPKLPGGYPTSPWDVLLKLKYMRRNEAEYIAAPFPVKPAPYMLSHADKVMPAMERLRARHARGGYAYEVQTAGLYRTAGMYERQGFPARALSLRANPHLNKGRFGSMDAYLHALAESRFVAHISGCQDSIDMRFVQGAAIGVPVLSSPGLRDYVLPDGKDIEGGIFWVEEGADLEVEASKICEGEHAAARQDMKRLFDTYFHPQEAARWMLKAMSL